MLSSGDTQPQVDALVVEDDPIINLHLVDALESQGLLVAEFLSAEDALAYLQQRSGVRLLVTDLEFHSAFDGLALARKARELHPEIGLIIATARARDELGPVPTGAIYLAKPFSQSQIDAALLNALASQEHVVPDA
jgi:DNA-binding NtrC family response regulator